MDFIRICRRCRRGNPASHTRCADCGAGIEHVAPVQRVADAEPMRVLDGPPCPECGEPMQSGGAWVQVPARRWGWSALLAELAFRGRDEHDPVRVLDYGEVRHAARCLKCGGTWIRPPRPSR